MMYLRYWMFAALRFYRLPALHACNEQAAQMAKNYLLIRAMQRRQFTHTGSCHHGKASFGIFLLWHRRCKGLYHAGYTQRNLKKLQEWGLRVNALTKVVQGADGCIAYYEKLMDERDALPYEIDGVVYKVNSIEYQQQLGLCDTCAAVCHCA